MPNATLARPARARKAVAPASSVTVLWLPFVATLLLAAFPVFFSRIGDNPRLANTFCATSGALLVFLLFVRQRAIRAARTLRYEFLAVKSHYVQLCMHTCLYAYWGWYWREVYDHIPLFLAQIVFAYAFDMLLCWARRDKWILGFGPIPIILSTNLFLWFRDDWFYLQFLMIAIGVLGKEFIKWRREGRLVHIFNPSALALFIFSVVLIATKATGITWGVEIADALHRPPYIYLEIFLLGLIVQGLFQVTLVTLFSAVALCVLNLLYTHVTGNYNFIDSNIPVSVFLGLHLLVTDPATSPRRSLGKMIFGLLYGAGVFGMYRLLVAIGAPEFYDKLLCVPALNLCVRALDHLSELTLRLRPPWLRVPAWLRNGTSANYAWMSVWILFFVGMTTSGFLSKGMDHPGSDPEHWRRACESGQTESCAIWARILNAMCDSNNQDACLHVAHILNLGRLVPRDAAKAGVTLGRACDLGSKQACSELIAFVLGEGKDVLLKSCDGGDGASCFVLGSLYSGGNGLAEDGQKAFQLFQKSCDAGWWRGCGRLGVSYLVGQGVPKDTRRAVDSLEKGCAGENAASCYQVARVYWEGPAGTANKDLARKRLAKACTLGLQAACEQAQHLPR
jgi:TPR repeat protein